MATLGHNRKPPATIQDQGMPISQIPLFSMLRTKMHWHQERQRLLAENVANADTPKFQPRDLAPPALDRMQPTAMLSLARTSAAHLAGPSGGTDAAFALDRRGGFEVRPGGNAVNLEDEMLKVASNQMDYQAATALYSRGLGLIKTALGKRS
jgi:flagellar basal-body rod protein FlgB